MPWKQGDINTVHFGSKFLTGYTHPEGVYTVVQGVPHLNVSEDGLFNLLMSTTTLIIRTCCTQSEKVKTVYSELHIYIYLYQ